MKILRQYGPFTLLLLSLACNGATPAPTSVSGTTDADAVSAVKASPESLEANPAVVEDAKKSLAYLAGDKLEGRGVGTKGIDLAADYIADRYREAGLKPLPGQKDYFQRFDYTVSTTVGKATALTLAGKKVELHRGYIPLGMSAEKSFDAPVIFAGYGVSSPEEFKYDDYAGIDVKGKVVLVMRYEPRDEEGKSRFTQNRWSSQASFIAKASAAEEHGAIALLVVNPPNAKAGADAPTTAPSATPSEDSDDGDEPTTAPSRRQRDPDRLMRFSTTLGGHVSIPIIHIKQTEAEVLLAKSGAPTLRELQATIDQTTKPKSFALNDAVASGNVAIERTKAEIKNVMGVLPGKGPQANEYVVVGAHYDHLGFGSVSSLSPGSKEIHHGADDNGSGTTALLETADQIALDGQRNRSVIFVAFTAEEVGLIGSEHFVDHPPVPLDRIAAMLNMDMVGRITNEVLYVGGSGTAPSFESMLREADQGSPLDLKYVGPMLGKGGMGPSDHQSFAMKKIPVLFFFSGLHPDYHRPTDTADKINYEGLGQSVALARRLVEQMASMPREQYVADFDSSSNRGGGGPEGASGGASLGVMPDYAASESSTGVRITGTRPQSAADKAGLKDGDTIVQVDSKKIGSLYDLMDVLSEHKGGDKVKITVVRDEKRVELDATLAARGG